MNKNVAGKGGLALPWKPQAWVILALVAILMALGGYLAYRAWLGSPPDASEPSAVTISEATLESEYGLHLNLVAVIAAGGIVDVRFKVMDSQKAAQALGTDQPQLAVIAEDSDTVIQAPPDTRQHFDLQDGTVYFVQFPNRGHAVEAGRSVSLILGNVRLEHVVVR